MTNTNRTAAQNARNASRTNGKFRANKCHCCGKGAPMDYFSDERAAASGGWGNVLCEKCADILAEMGDADYAARAAK